MMWNQLDNRIKWLIHAEQGVTAAEYAICLAMIVLGSVVAVAALGLSISELFPNLAEYIEI